MKYVALIFLFLIGCMPSIYSLKDSEKKQVTLVLQSSSGSGKDTVGVLLSDADENNLYGQVMYTQTSYQFNANTKSYNLLTGIDGTRFAKNKVISIKDMNGNDLTSQYLLFDAASLSAKSQEQMTKIQSGIEFAVFIIAIDMTASIIWALTLSK